ncbi:hypothetical protein J4401_04295 [Candidatus Woesearchaeota archaeon]|nr:hypothetical protein [Candidatus Woesearchaeota archaeon]
MVNNQYFEGVLQLRDPTQQIIDYIEEEVSSNKKVHIAKSVRHKRGIDLYISSNKFLKDLGKKLKKKFTGELIYSNTLFTRNKFTSKDVYRGCVLFRHVPLKKGDVISYKGDEIEVIYAGKEILGRNVRTSEKIHIKFDKLR